jgi:hypothetical protein
MTGLGGGVPSFGNYFSEGVRNMPFGAKQVKSVKKYHRTISSYFNSLIRAGFSIDQVCEPCASAADVENGLAEESRRFRPVMLFVRAVLPL